MSSQWVGRGLVGLAAGGALAATVTVVGPVPAGSTESIAAPTPPVTAPATTPAPTAGPLAVVRVPTSAPVPTTPSRTEARAAPRTTVAEPAGGAPPDHVPEAVTQAAPVRAAAPPSTTFRAAPTTSVEPAAEPVGIDPACDGSPVPGVDPDCDAPRPVPPVEPAAVPDFPDVDAPDGFSFDRRYGADR